MHYCWGATLTLASAPVMPERDQVSETDAED
jgi:hypothetical protein